MSAQVLYTFLLLWASACYNCILNNTLDRLLGMASLILQRGIDGISKIDLAGSHRACDGAIAHIAYEIELPLAIDEPEDICNRGSFKFFCTRLKSWHRTKWRCSIGLTAQYAAGIIHYEDLRLSQYRGNLSEFVKQKPEARSYYELSNLNLKFKFPEPGFLEGVKSKDRAILKMNKAGIRCGSQAFMHRLYTNNLSLEIYFYHLQWQWQSYSPVLLISWCFSNLCKLKASA